LLVGDGGNVTVQAGPEGVLVVDTQSAAAAPKVRTAIKTFSDKPILWMINTSLDPDHTGGNEALGQRRDNQGQQPRVIAYEKVLDRLVNTPSRYAEAGTINDTYDTVSKDFLFNGEAVVVYHAPAAHTDGDSLVFFRRSDVLSVGDLFTPDRYPVIDLQNGGSVQGLLNGLNFILDLAVAGRYQEGGTFVIPGHGRLCDEADVVEFRDMVRIITDRIQDSIKKGMNLEQVKASKPSRDYDTQYVENGGWTGDMFVEAIYKSLTSK
jgi:glyoxylase-like metal-dependent hydrolase (beta-lactamase superfamily II)